MTSFLYAGSSRSFQHFGHRQLLLLLQLGVVAERENAAVDAGHAILRNLGDAPRPVVKLRRRWASDRSRAGLPRRPADRRRAGPAHQMSPFGLALSAFTCASISPVAFCTTATLMPVAFSKPTAMPWHHAVLGELQYRLSWPAAGKAAKRAARQRRARRRIMRNSVSERPPRAGREDYRLSPAQVADAS